MMICKKSIRVYSPCVSFFVSLFLVSFVVCACVLRSLHFQHSIRLEVDFFVAACLRACVCVSVLIHMCVVPIFFFSYIKNDS